MERRAKCPSNYPPQPVFSLIFLLKSVYIIGYSIIIDVAPKVYIVSCIKRIGERRLPSPSIYKESVLKD
jgi:hypothetical protein